MISEAFYKLGLITFVLLCNTLITFVCAFEVMYACHTNGWSKPATLVAAVVAAVCVYTYIRFNHLILVRFKMEKEKNE
jgi:hypothetical protein